jgi:regulatory protein
MPKTEHQLRDNLKKKLIPQDIIDETMQKLIESGFVNDKNFAENFIYSKRKYEKLGSSAIRMKLLQKGISGDIIEELLSEVTQDDLKETATALAEKKMRSLMREPDRNKRIQKLVSFLAYRGYGAGVAFEIAREVVDKNAENDPDSV